MYNLKMEHITKQFLNSPSEDNGVKLVIFLREINAHHSVLLIGKFLLTLYPESINIRVEMGVSAFFAKKYRMSYTLYTQILKSPTLNELDRTSLRKNMSFSINHISNEFINYNKEIVDEIVTRQHKPIPLVTFTITSCKRFDLFEKTINSFLNCCTDIDRIDHWLCVDDNSSEEDRTKMKELYPFFEFYWKTPEEKGHPTSMNIIRDNVKTEFIFHMEDDWKFFECRNYIGQCIDVILSDKDIHQCLINRNYSETADDINIVGGLIGIAKNGTIFYKHEYTPDDDSKQEFIKKYGSQINSAYWPHFSFRPSLFRRYIMDILGAYNKNISHFEMDYSNKYTNAGFKSAFLNGIFCLHIGRLTSQRDTKTILNAYDLNNEIQFGDKQVTSKRFSLKDAKTFVINLDERVDRLEKFKNGSTINFERFSAVNGEKLIPNQQLQRIFENNDYNMRVGIVGCAMSHIKLYIDLINSDVNMFCILEDDASFGPNFEEHLLHLLDIAPKNWDFMYLGHHLYPQFITEEVYKKDITPVLRHMTKTQSLEISMGGTHGYIIRKEGARKLLDFINTFGMTNGIDTIQQKAISHMETYYAYPHIVFGECALPGKKIDSDIQYSYKSANMTNFKDEGLYKERLKKDGKYNVDNALQVVKPRVFKYTNSWFDRNINISMNILKNLSGDRDIKILEVGTHEGKSAIWMLENLCIHPDSRLTSIDSYTLDDPSVNLNTYENFLYNIDLCTEKKKFNQILGNSKDIMPKLVEENKKYDIIYIDSTTDIELVFTDITNADKLIGNSGIILMDDVGFDESANTSVIGAIKRFLTKYPDVYRIILKEWQWMLQKI